MKKLCEHVSLDVNKETKVITYRGATYSYFAWDKERMMDTPRIRCSICYRFARILGFMVQREGYDGEKTARI